ncbi:uncharacterized protein LOC121554702 [Coregonus clupeaformis]|uniref:uncharacterized protein LOC121554702 n=1 Tax=Coregonus clupeaformis TaxID=59861 RepID=UPI001E1C67F9|nr:uncharacterized protein LOC121554702 [Coregonus clupeaformis]
MSYHQGAKGGAIPKERQKDGSPNKDFDETMDPHMSVHVRKTDFPTLSCESNRTLESDGDLSSNLKHLQLRTTSHMSMSGQSVNSSIDPSDDGDQSMDKRGSPERAESISSGVLSMKSDQSMIYPIHFKGGVSLRNKGPGEVVCDICSEVQAVKFCQTCSVSYCETHIRQHYTIAALQRHTVVDVTGDLVQKLCQHDYSPLEVFCRTDQMLICSQCAETKHKGHDTIFRKMKKTGRQHNNFYGDQHTTLTSDDVLPPPGDIQVLLLTLDSVSLSWGSPQGLTGPQTFRVTWGCDGETRSTRVKGGHHLEISSLQPGKKYQFNVATEGEDGSQSRCVSASLSTEFSR